MTDVSIEAHPAEGPLAAPEPGAWPLSAAATAVLRRPRTSGEVVLRLALRELVVRGVLRTGPLERRRCGADRVDLLPGDRPAGSLPAPLPQLAAALLPHVKAEGTDAAGAVQAAVGWRGQLVNGLRDTCREDLRARGLLVPARARALGLLPVTRWEPTPSGQAWARRADRLEREGTPVGVLPAAGLLLALDVAVARRLREGPADTGAAWAPPGCDLGALDDVLGDVGPALDTAADGGSSSADGGGGGDGGGGD